MVEGSIPMWQQQAIEKARVARAKRSRNEARERTKGFEPKRMLFATTLSFIGVPVEMNPVLDIAGIPTLTLDGFIFRYGGLDQVLVSRSYPVCGSDGVPTPIKSSAELGEFLSLSGSDCLRCI